MKQKEEAYNAIAVYGNSEDISIINNTVFGSAHHFDKTGLILDSSKGFYVSKKTKPIPLFKKLWFKIIRLFK